jgi:hypothetical protein
MSINNSIYYLFLWMPLRLFVLPVNNHCQAGLSGGTQFYKKNSISYVGKYMDIYWYYMDAH